LGVCYLVRRCKKNSTCGILPLLPRLEFHDELSHINQMYVFFVNANSLKNVLFLCEYHVVWCYKIFVTLLIYHLFKIFIVLATWNGTLIWYMFCLFVFNYCCLILTVTNLDGSNIQFVNSMYFPIYNIFYFCKDYNLCLIICTCSHNLLYKLIPLLIQIPLYSGSTREATNSSVAFLPNVWVTWTSKIRQCAKYET
jgi:hypothetical protein